MAVPTRTGGQVVKLVSHLAAEFDINPRTIRYYERVGLLNKQVER